MNWPLMLIVVAVFGLPGMIVVLARLADWLELGSFGDWVREQERRK